MKRFFLVFSILSIIHLYAEDKSLLDACNKFRDRIDSTMKFRGSIYLVAGYYLGVHDGIMDGNHTSSINYTPANYTDKTNGRVIGSSWGGLEGKLFINYSFIAPFLTADNFLLKNNNIQFTLLSEISPVSLKGGMSVTFTPLAFLNFNAGFMIGSGWHDGTLFYGLSRNLKGSIQDDTFYGPLMQIWFSATLQFDIAALIDGPAKRWSHIVMTATPTIKYQSLLNISESQPYLWEADYGDNLNGWRLMGSYLLGYQIPIIEDDTGSNRSFIKLQHKNLLLTLAMLVSMDYLNLSHYYDSQMSKGGWGSDFCFIEFGPIINFDLPNNFFVSTIFFWKNDKAYTADTVGYANFQDRIYQDWYVYFRRIDIAFGWNF